MARFPYQRIGAHHMPMAQVQLGFGGRVTTQQSFLVDSGSAITMAPFWRISALIEDIDIRPEEYAGVQDASGGRLTGVPIDVEIRIQAVAPIMERVWFRKNRLCPFALLGQSWMEQVGIAMRNFPKHPDGRCFHLFAKP